MPKTNADCFPMPPAASASDAVVGLYDVPPIWGHVLDYLPYAMMSVALSAVHEDVQEEVELAITPLNLTEAEQLDAPSTGGGRSTSRRSTACPFYATYAWSHGTHHDGGVAVGCGCGS